MNFFNVTLLHFCFRKKRVTLPGDELPYQEDIPSIIGVSKSISQTISFAETTVLCKTTAPSVVPVQTLHTTPGQPKTVENTYAIPQRIEYKQDLKATLVEKYAEPQYQNIPNDILMKRKNSVDANTMTSWTKNGMPVSTLFYWKHAKFINKLIIVSGFGG